MTHWLDALKFDENGLIPAIAQDRDTGKILMMAWQNRKALELTAKTGTGVYFSRSRGKLWHKGETSGHTQIVHEIRTDCDADVIILIITQIGDIACHTGRASCFYKSLDTKCGEWLTTDDVIKDPSDIYGKTSSLATTAKTHLNTNIIRELDAILHERKHADKDSSYVASLYHKGLNKILEKIGEESTESIIAAKELELIRSQNQDDTAAKSDVIYEIADMWFHSLVALHRLNLLGDDVLTELGRRFGLSGIDEKNSRTS